MAEEKRAPLQKRRRTFPFAGARRHRPRSRPVPRTASRPHRAASRRRAAPAGSGGGAGRAGLRRRERRWVWVWGLGGERCGVPRGARKPGELRDSRSPPCLGVESGAKGGGLRCMLHLPLSCAPWASCSPSLNLSFLSHLTNKDIYMITPTPYRLKRTQIGSCRNVLGLGQSKKWLNI